MLKTVDGGKTFQRQGLGLSSLQGIALTDLFVVNRSEVWVVGNSCTLLHTMDGGDTWMNISLPNSNPDINLYGITYMNGAIYLSGDEGVVYKSTDNGTNWTLCNTAGLNSIMLQGIWAITSDRVFAVGQYVPDIDRGLISYTEDGGTSWDTLMLSDDFNRHEWIGACSYGNSIVIYGTKNYYTYSTNNGITWLNDSINVPGAGGGADINHLVMLDEKTWWAALDNGHISRTTDGGLSWSQPNTGLGVAFMLGIDFWNYFEAISVGEYAGWPRYGPVAHTSNAGNSWTKDYTHSGALHHVGCVRD
ncbi:MAG: WD40/YVTN/BNR-like repeat-containing protein [Bacteroidota bacterium]